MGGQNWHDGRSGRGRDKHVQAGADAELWEKAVRKLRGRVMPPAGQPQPEQKTSMREHARSLCSAREAWSTSKLLRITRCCGGGEGDGCSVSRASSRRLNHFGTVLEGRARFGGRLGQEWPGARKSRGFDR